MNSVRVSIIVRVLTKDDWKQARREVVNWSIPLLKGRKIGFIKAPVPFDTEPSDWQRGDAARFTLYLTDGTQAGVPTPDWAHQALELLPANDVRVVSVGQLTEAIAKPQS